MPATRRQFLVGAGATGAAAVLAACGGASSSRGSTIAAPDGDPFTLVKRFPDAMLVPGPVRLPVSIVRAGTLQPGGPPVLRGTVLDAGDDAILQLDAARRNDGTEVAYWAFRPTIDTPGIYTLRVEGDDGFGAAFEVSGGAATTLPVRGSTLPPFDTPTVADHRGVEPYCSHSAGPCPLHEITLTEALASGRPVAYLVGTPGHCQTGTCEPGLDFLVAAKQRLGDALAAVHADVYADDAATTLSPAVQALGIDYEPALYLCAAGGTIVDHLDGIWDRSELDEVLGALVG